MPLAFRISLSRGLCEVSISEMWVDWSICTVKVEGDWSEYGKIDELDHKARPHLSHVAWIIIVGTSSFKDSYTRIGHNGKYSVFRRNIDK